MPHNKKHVRLLKMVMSAFIIVPSLVVSIVGLITISSLTAASAAKRNEESALSQAAEISGLVGEYTDFLSVIAELKQTKETVAKKTGFKEWGEAVAASSEQGEGVYDILITDDDGYIFMSQSDDYDGAELFFDPDMTIVAGSPTPVSGFYDGGRFYAAKPIEQSGGVVGYIILITEPGLIEEMDLSITVSDEPDYEATLTGEIEGTKWRWGLDYSAAQTNTETFKVWITAFAAAAVICVINMIIMQVVTKKVGDE